MLLKRWGFLFSLVAICLYLLHPMMIGVARAGDTDGPSGYSSSRPPNTDNNAKGPCNDPHSYTGSGTGNGYCGRCGDITWTYSGGACQGTSSASCPDCLNTQVPATIVDTYISTPVGSIMYAVCFAGYGLCLATDGILDAAVCGSACIVGGVFTLGASCIACIAGAGAIAAGCTCAYDECKEDCNYDHSDPGAGNAAACFS